MPARPHRQQKLGVVVVGAGFGCRVHVPALRAAGLDVVAVVARDRARAAPAATRAGVDTVCGSLEEALSLPRADVVVVSTPPVAHAELAQLAIEAGRHVLVEKPFTTTVEDARQLMAMADRAGVVALVGHEFRFAPERVTLRDALLEGSIGPPRMATFVGHSSFAASAGAPIPAWWFDRGSGGGWLGAGVSHVIDAIRVWLGEFESVSASLPVVSNRDPATHAEDSVVARFRTRAGCEAALQHSAGTWGDRVDIVRVAGPHGTLSLEGSVVTFSDESGSRAVEPARALPAAVGRDGTPSGLTGYEPAIVQAEVFRELCLGGTLGSADVGPATFADGLASVQVMDAMRRSAAARGASVDVE